MVGRQPRVYKRRRDDRTQRIVDICISALVSTCLTAVGYQIVLNSHSSVVADRVERMQQDISEMKKVQIPKDHFDATANKQAEATAAVGETAKSTEKVVKEVHKGVTDTARKLNDVTVVHVVPNSDKLPHPVRPVK